MGISGCAGIGIDDIIPDILCCVDTGRTHHEQARSLSLADLEDVRPHYISNIVVNEWRRTRSISEPKYDLLTLSPSVIERVGRQPGDSGEFDGRMEPEDVKLSDAMTTSAAAVARHMGAFNQSAESFKHIQTILGLGMGASMISDTAAVKREGFCMRVSVVDVFARCLCSLLLASCYGPIISCRYELRLLTVGPSLCAPSLNFRD